MILEVNSNYTFTVRDIRSDDGVSHFDGIYLGTDIVINGCAIEAFITYRTWGGREKIAFYLNDLVSARANNRSD